VAAWRGERLLCAKKARGASIHHRPEERTEDDEVSPGASPKEREVGETQVSFEKRLSPNVVAKNQNVFDIS
jgi:hypothetical protein